MSCLDLKIWTRAEQRRNLVADLERLRKSYLCKLFEQDEREFRRIVATLEILGSDELRELKEHEAQCERNARALAG